MAVDAVVAGELLMLRMRISCLSVDLVKSLESVDSMESVESDSMESESE
jgi:hypothetical protein